MEKDFYQQVCAIQARHYPSPFLRTHLPQVLPHSTMVQATASEDKHNHELPARRDVQESRKVFHGNFRQTHTMANFRQEQDCQRVGSVGKGQSLRTRWMMASQTRLHILYNKD